MQPTKTLWLNFFTMYQGSKLFWRKYRRRGTDQKMLSESTWPDHKWTIFEISMKRQYQFLLLLMHKPLRAFPGLQSTSYHQDLRTKKWRNMQLRLCSVESCIGDTQLQTRYETCSICTNLFYYELNPLTFRFVSCLVQSVTREILHHFVLHYFFSCLSDWSSVVQFIQGQ